MTENGIVHLDRVHHMLEELGDMEDDIFRDRRSREQEQKQRNQRRIATAHRHGRGEQLDRRQGWSPSVPLLPVRTHNTLNFCASFHSFDVIESCFFFRIGEIKSAREVKREQWTNRARCRRCSGRTNSERSERRRSCARRPGGTHEASPGPLLPPPLPRSLHRLRPTGAIREHPLVSRRRRSLISSASRISRLRQQERR